MAHVPNTYDRLRLGDDAAESSSEEVDNDNDEPHPKPISSESSDNSKSNSSDEEGDDLSIDSSISKGGLRVNKSSRAESHLFSPYRSIGIVSSGRPFYVLPHENSNTSMLCVPIGERFQLLQTDKLQPVLVSQTVHCPSSLKNGRSNSSSSPSSSNQMISNCVSDSGLSITVVSHGRSVSTAIHVTLFRRTAPIDTQTVIRQRSNNNKTLNNSNSSMWSISSLLHLGRVKQEMHGEKLGKKESVAVVAAVLTKEIDDTAASEAIGVTVVDNDESDSDASSCRSHDDDNDFAAAATVTPTAEDHHHGEVVLFFASRTALTKHRCVRLTDSYELFRPVTAMHPATYLNKIVVGGSNVTSGNGMILLLNIRSSKIIHSFVCLPEECKTVTCMEQSPVVDTAAIGTSCGRVLLVNLRVDQLLFALEHASAITSISFRTDGSALRYQIAPLAVGRADGTVTIWDLTSPEDAGVGRTILTELKNCHPGGVSKLAFLPQEPLLVSCGTNSNAVVMHVFDSPNHSGRILKQRKGHSSAPSLIRYVHEASGGVQLHDGTDAAACQILSTGGLDRSLRIFSTARSVLDKEFSQGKGLEKRAKRFGMDQVNELLLPPVVGLAISDARSRDWGDLVTIHASHSFAYVWSTKQGAQSGPLLKQETWKISSMKTQPPLSSHATSIAMSACGNFALVGTIGGTVYKYNVQSGNARGSFPRNVEEGSEKRKKKRLMPGNIARMIKELEKTNRISNRVSNLDKKDIHAEYEAHCEKQILSKLALASHTGYAVTGIAVDALNRTVVSVGTDKKLIMWNFSSHAPHKNSPYLLSSPAAKMQHIRESDLAAIALEDFSVVLFDCSSLSIVRRFGGMSAGHTGPISDLCFSPDGRTLFTSSLDRSIRVYDIPTSSCIEWLTFRAAPTSMTISPTGEFIATTHVGKLGIYMLSDRSYYQTVHPHGGPLTEPVCIDDPAPISEVFTKYEDDYHDAYLNPIASSSVSQSISRVTEELDKDISPKQAGLVTLSGTPVTHWKTLFHLELIKERNRPTKPPTKPPAAPFFLQWRSGEFIGADEAAIEDRNKNYRDGGAVNDDEEWAAAWSDDDAEGKDNLSSELESKEHAVAARKRETCGQNNVQVMISSKRPKVSHHRSQLASLLTQADTVNHTPGTKVFQHVTQYLGTLGPSAIDVALSSLCSGFHDLDEGLPILLLACSWLAEALDTRERFEVVNAYLHRFLHLYSPLLAEIQTQNEVALHDTEDVSFNERLTELLRSVDKLKKTQQTATEALRDKVQHSLCLLRHLSRMV